MSDQGRRVAVVTGATSGIGLAVATLLAERGASVFICARNAGSVTATVGRLRDGGLEVDGTTCDVRSREDVRSFVRAAVDRYGPVDILVNNAGRTGGGVTTELTDELWYDVIDTNLNSVFLMTREVLTTGGMQRRAKGRIINVASTAGRRGMPHGAPYSASKHGVVGFTRALGNELARSGITVNAVCPGYVETPFGESVVRGHIADGAGSESDVLQKFQAEIPLGRYSTPEEVAGMVEYLVSDTAASITSQAINVCGGLSGC
ncbi:3-oxoacyl-ACP reductase FabG [Wenjunlia tyrosinilytica]|uniref:Ketoacyl reductase n=1 Tax=Wenjunlia tyrosinilytica TaxID=1544741 RepID=A0A918DW79_9ACTN|nr:3-oxoacyl-ACP reductase FabG [Wenjunlia tyrosinilytica]GGO85210.1 putative ketoacyl reductase [Wenjunlia tyrosinilytica]